ncbi:MAG TPA: sialidase family protein [Tepidisphaeraceae bacterium]|jgi:hypothetical protein
MRIWLLAAVLTFLPTGARAQVPTLTWDQKTLRLIEEGADYGRMVRLKDGRVACVYDHGGSMWFRTSDDGGMTFGQRVLVARDESCWLTNADLLPLKDRTLLYFWNQRPREALQYEHKRAPEGKLTRPFRICMARSTDDGKTWSEPVTLYSAGVNFRDGCWEPAGVELPDGEVQVYFSNEGVFLDSNEQEIALLRSSDAGKTWSHAQRVSYRKGHRDGMPSPLVLAGGKGIAFAIEDDGVAGRRFKPSIIWTPLEENWKGGSVEGESPRRWSALAKPLDAKWYAGAPNLKQLPSGHTLLSFQESEDGTLRHARMAVCVGDHQAKNFQNKTYPLGVDQKGSQLWNSLFVKDEKTVTAIATATVEGTRGVWAIDAVVSLSFP